MSLRRVLITGWHDVFICPVEDNGPKQFGPFLHACESQPLHIRLRVFAYVICKHKLLQATDHRVAKAS